MNLTNRLRYRRTVSRIRYRNWLNRRARQRGKTPLPDRIARRLTGIRTQVRYRLANNRTRARVRNWLNRRAWQRGKTPLPDRIARRFSGLPVYRNRINRATGRPHRDDRRIGAVQDQAFARWRQQREQAERLAQAYADRRSARAEGNQRFVRETLAERQPRYARALESAVRETAPRRSAARTGRSR